LEIDDRKAKFMLKRMEGRRSGKPGTTYVTTMQKHSRSDGGPNIAISHLEDRIVRVQSHLFHTGRITSHHDRALGGFPIPATLSPVYNPLRLTMTRENSDIVAWLYRCRLFDDNDSVLSEPLI
jgi:hypothetical protein